MKEIGHLVDIGDFDFEKEVLKSRRPVLVDFWANRCTPCRTVGSILESLARDYSDRVKFCRLNVEENPRSRSRYSVLSIPTLLLFQKGVVKGQITGRPTKEKIERFIREMACRVWERIPDHE